MALKALMLAKSIKEKKKELERVNEQAAAIEKREAELADAIEQAETDEEREAVEEAVTEHEKEKADNQKAREELEDKIHELETQLEAEETEEREEEETPPEEQREETKNMSVRTKIFDKIPAPERAAMFNREDVKSYLSEVRTSISEKRAITNAGLTIPRVFLGLLRENIMDYSKLYKHVNARPVGGEGREVIMGTVPEGVWTDCCANLNELTLVFNDVEVDCWKVGGYFAICNAILEDSDIDLAAEIMTALGQAIGLALDKAILFGTGTRMPLGIATRLGQASQPSGYPATARPWVNLSATNISTVDLAGGAETFQGIITKMAAAKGSYSRGEFVWVMNEGTYTKLMSAAVAMDASGAYVSRINGVMPVVGGVIEVLSFVPDGIIIGGYFDLYLLAERAGAKFATSEHVRFINDQTVLRGTARYDGQPAIAEGFIELGSVDTYGEVADIIKANEAVTFAADTANAGA